MQRSTSWHMCTDSSERKGEMNRRVLVTLSVDVFISSLACGNDLTQAYEHSPPAAAATQTPQSNQLPTGSCFYFTFT